MSNRANRRLRRQEQRSEQKVTCRQEQGVPIPTTSRPRLLWVVLTALALVVAVLGARQVSRAAEVAPSLATASLPAPATVPASKQVRASTLPTCVPAQEGDVNAKWRRALGKHNEGGQVTLLLRDEETGEMSTLAAPLGTRLPHKEDGPGGEMVLARLASLPEHMDLEHFAFNKQPIETVQKGQKVVTRDPQTGQTELRTVAQTFEHPATEIVELELANAETGTVVDKLRGTPEHPFFTPTGIVPMGQLAVGAQVHTRAGPTLVVKSTKREAHPEGIPVYNFEVEGDHTYFVGQANGGTWVHNTCPGNVLKVLQAVGKADVTAASKEEALSWAREAFPDAMELPEATAGQPYPKAPAGVKDTFQVHPAEPDVNNMLPHVKYEIWSPGKRLGSYGHIWFPDGG